MGAHKIYIEVVLIMILGIIWLSIPITPSSASTLSEAWKQTCWHKLARCLKTTLNETTLLEIIDPEFTATHLICCSVIQEEVKGDDKTCFCEGAIAIAEKGSLYASGMNAMLSTCNVTGPVKALCSGASGREIGWAMLLSTLFIVSACSIHV